MKLKMPPTPWLLTLLAFELAYIAGWLTAVGSVIAKVIWRMLK